MGKGTRAVEVFIMILLAAASGLLLVAGQKDSIGAYSSGWYLASVATFAGAGFIAVTYFLLHPAVVTLDSRRTRILNDRGPNVGGRDRLVITRATYGATEGSREVTEHVAALVYEGRQLRMPVTNDEFGPPDPAPLVPKVLIVEYVFDGRAGSASFPEHEIAILPEGG